MKIVDIGICKYSDLKVMSEFFNLCICYFVGNVCLDDEEKLC